MFPKIVGFPPKSSILIGFSIIFTIHFGGPPLFFGNSQMNVNRLMGGHSPALTQSGLARRHRKRPYVPNKTSSAMARGDRRKHSTLYTPKKKNSTLRWSTCCLGTRWSNAFWSKLPDMEKLQCSWKVTIQMWEGDDLATTSS